MTLIVTERAGMLAIFTHEGTGELRQRAVIDVEGMEPSHKDLAQLGEELSDHFRWGDIAVGSPPSTRGPMDLAKPPTPAPLPPGAQATPVKAKSPRKTASRSGTSNRPKGRILPRGRLSEKSIALRAQFEEEIIAEVSRVPGSTHQQVASSTHISYQTLVRLMADLAKSGRLNRDRPNGAEQFRYHLPTSGAKRLG